MKKYFRFLAISAAAMLGLLLSAGPAAAQTFDFGSLTIVEADPFADGGVAGNTTAAGGGFYSAPAAAVGVWQNRTIGGFLTGYNFLPGASDRVYESLAGLPGPELVTTITGLTPGEYEVSLVHVIRLGTNGGILANLNGAVDSFDITQHYGDDDVDVIIAGFGSADNFQVVSAVLGTTAVDATGFTVNVEGDVIFGRSAYIGVAYRNIAIPEPSSLLLVVMGVAGLLLLRRRQ